MDSDWRNYHFKHVSNFLQFCVQKDNTATYAVHSLAILFCKKEKKQTNVTVSSLNHKGHYGHSVYPAMIKIADLPTVPITVL
jgi:hypothetical protein